MVALELAVGVLVSVEDVFVEVIFVVVVLGRLVDDLDNTVEVLDGVELVVGAPSVS